MFKDKNTGTMYGGCNDVDSATPSENMIFGPKQKMS